MESVVKRFLRYVTYDTQSCDNSNSVPSTECQMVFLRILESELIEMGLESVELSQTGYLMATIPATSDEYSLVMGLLAHVDTSPEITGKSVNPQVIDCYDGNDIALSETVVMRTKDFPELLSLKGQQIITTDGSTLLGADDKAGVAIIMTLAQNLISDKKIKHGKIRIAFTPDEEVGRGMDHFDTELFGADFAYTIDGGRLGEFEYESFNAAEANITIQGRSVHPGYAKNKMINALEIARDIDSLLPKNERPQYTDGYEGYYHLMKVNGGIEDVSMHYIIRDHNKELFEQRKAKMQTVIDTVNERFDFDVASLSLRDEYYNMKDPIMKNMDIVHRVIDKMNELGIEPIVKPIRGGTDGCRLSYMGVPCPNIFTGGENFHGRFEYLSCHAMAKSLELLVALVQIKY